SATAAPNASSWQASRSEPVREERQDLVARCDRRLTRFVDQVSRDNAVRACHHLVEERRGGRIGGAVGQYAGDEALTERFAERGEALRLAVLVAFESIGHDGQILALQAFSNICKLGGC